MPGLNFDFLAPLLRDGALELISWRDAMRFWRDEHLRRVRGR